MSVPTGTLQTPTLTNIREDLENLIYNVDPYKTPVLNMARKTKAESTLHEWDTDSLRAQSTTNAQIQGDDATGETLTATARLGNYTQISRGVIVIARTTQSVRAAGGSNKMGYQLAKEAKALKKDIEGSMTKNAARVAPGASTAGVSAGLPAWFTVNTVFNSGGTPAGANPSGTTSAGPDSFGNGTTTRTYSGTTQALAEADIDSVAQKIYSASGDSPPYCVLSPVNKQNVSKFTGVAGTRFNRVEDKVLKNAIDEYETDFGTIRMVPDIFLAQSGDVYFLDPEYLKVAYLDGFKTVPLAKTGDADKKMLIVEWALEVCNERAMGARFDTTG